jgi:tRNA nucleotidyltransferase (CCA-adding enzyme)
MNLEELFPRGRDEFDKLKRLFSLKERSSIISNKQFQRLLEKTQVLLTRNGMPEIITTRFSHSYDVAHSAEIMCEKIAADLGVSAKDIDYQHSLYNACLLHDIGHPPFGHEGSEFIHQTFKELGVTDGFSDNNNNLVVIEKNKILTSDYTLASVIKYPNLLYKAQKEIYLPILENALEQDRTWFNNLNLNFEFSDSMRLTIACQIMDEADRNTYVCSDLSDFFSLGNTLNENEFSIVKGYERLDDKYKKSINAICDIVGRNRKTEIKEFFSNLKNDFNENYHLSESGIVPVDTHLYNFREFLNRVELKYFIKPLAKSEREENIVKLKDCIDFVLENEYYPSESYRNKINNAQSEVEKFTYIRDMIAEVSDWYVIKFQQKRLSRELNLSKEIGIPVDRTTQVMLVGGAVRDKLLGVDVKDKDYVVVSAESNDLLALGFNQVGKDFPVFLHPETKDEYALARKEIKVGIGYHGFEFDCSKDVSIEDDLYRRDLTINAIASYRGRLIDPYNGVSDLNNKILRHVSDHFKEDPVRVLRIARFKARYNNLGFEIADETMELMKEMVRNSEVDNLTPERVMLEMSKAFQEEKPSVFFEVLRECGALKVLFPHVDRLFGVPQRADYHPEIDSGIHTLMVIDQGRRLCDGNFNIMYACLTHDLGKGITPEDILPQHFGHEKNGVPLVEEMSDQYKVPAKAKKLAMLNCEYHLNIHKAFELSPKKIFSLFKSFDAIRNEEIFKNMLIACKADARGRTGYENIEYKQKEYFEHVHKFIVAETKRNYEIAEKFHELANKGLIEKNEIGVKIKLSLENKYLSDISTAIEFYEDNISKLIKKVQPRIENIKNSSHQEVIELFSELKVDKDPRIIKFVFDKIGVSDEKLESVVKEYSNINGKSFVEQGIKGKDIAVAINEEKKRVLNKFLK